MKIKNCLGNFKIKTKFAISFMSMACISFIISAMAIYFLMSASNSDISMRMTTAAVIIGALCLINIVAGILLYLINVFEIKGPMDTDLMITAKILKGNFDYVGELTKADYARFNNKDECGEFTRSYAAFLTYLKEVIATLVQIAEGDLTVDVTERSDKDMLGQSLKRLVDNFHQVVSTTVTAVNEVSMGSNLVSNSSLTLSDGASSQASSVQQLSASVEQIASQTNQNSENAQNANTLTKTVKIDAETSNEQMKEMVRAIDDINSSSSNISKIIKVIDDIAFQTNILALNAAVEAARAGQHGKGFAVVAEEVRTLAAKSAKAAKETTDLIEGSKVKVDKGTKIADETASSLANIVTQVTTVAELIESIASASKEQATALEHINQGVVQISNVVQNNAATSEESAAASEELSSQAAQLKDVVSIFKVRNVPPQQKSFVVAKNVRTPTLTATGNRLGKY